VLTACAVCGLEFSFWQEATSSCGELLDQLLLAGALWLLFEFNVRQNTRWLDAATIVWGLGMAENWVMLVTFPFFIIGVIWLLRLDFFRWQVILRLAVLGLMGFSIYFVQPMANGLMPHSPWTLHQAWIASLRQTKNIFLLLYYQFWRGHRLLTIAVVIYFLVPTLPLLVRMRDQGTHNISGVDRFQIWIYRTLRVGLLVACFWLAFDPTTAARQMVQHQMGIWMPMLTFDYLNALGVGFLVGNLLLISQPVAARDDYYNFRPRFPWARFASPAATVTFVLIVIGLAARNGPAIWSLNFHPIEEFGSLAVKSLPAGRGVVLCDFPDKLVVFQAALAHNHETADWLTVDTRTLPAVAYRAALERRQPDGWLTETNRHPLTPLETLRLLEQVARTNRLFYLHPSFGYFFERFYLEPTGTIYEMKLRGKDPLDIPPMSSAATEANEQFWTDVWNKDLARLAPPSARRSNFEYKMAHYGLIPAPRSQDRLLADWYSIPLDDWGVNLQKQGHLREAQVRLEQAIRLNTNNLSARITLSCNTNLQAGVKMGLSDVVKVAGQLGNLDRLNLIVSSGGPFDEPTVGYLMGSSFMDHGLLLQAAEQLERVRALTPGALAPELALAEIYNRLQMADRGRPLINHIKEETKNLPANSSLDLDVALVDSYSWLLQTNADNARSVLRAVVAQHPNDPQITGRVLAAYAALGDLTNALRLADAQLARAPDDITSLNTKAMLLMQFGRPAEAVTILDHVLTLTNLPAIHVNRAFAHLAAKDFALAETDLRELEKSGNASPMVNFGLATVAQNNHDTNQATHYLRLCVTNSPVGSPLWQQATARLQTFEPPPPK
jgi:tetratricopeptide (TPR) repeat protein